MVLAFFLSFLLLLSCFYSLCFFPHVSTCFFLIFTFFYMSPLIVFPSTFVAFFLGFFLIFFHAFHLFIFFLISFFCSFFLHLRFYILVCFSFLFSFFLWWWLCFFVLLFVFSFFLLSFFAFGSCFSSVLSALPIVFFLKTIKQKKVLLFVYWFHQRLERATRRERNQLEELPYLSKLFLINLLLTNINTNGNVMISKIQSSFSVGGLRKKIKPRDHYVILRDFIIDKRIQDYMLDICLNICLVLHSNLIFAFSIF